MRPPADYDLLDPGVVEDPYPFFAALREFAPVYRVPGTEVFLVSTAEGDEDAAADAAAARADGKASADAGGRRSSKRSRSDADAPSASGCVSTHDGVSGGSGGGGGDPGLLKLSPVDESAADYWSSAPSSQMPPAGQRAQSPLTRSR